MQRYPTQHIKQQTRGALGATLRAVGIMIGMSCCAVAADTIRIAMVGPFTGPVTQFGQMVEEGTLTAVERINAAGGVRGKTVEIVKMDDGCEPKQAPTVASRVVNEGISFVIGHVCSGVTAAAAEIYDNAGVLMVTPTATSPVVTDGKNYEFIFRTIGRDDQQGPAAAEFIMAKLKPQRIAVLHDKRANGQGIATATYETLKKGGANVVLFEGINAGDSDYSAVITKLKSLNVDLVYFGGYHPEMGLLLRQGSEQGLKTQFMASEATANETLNAIAGDAVEGMLLMYPADVTRDPNNAAIVQAFQDKGRDPGGTYQLMSYSAALVIAEAIKATDSEDPAKVAAWLHANAVDTPIGQLSWDRQGDLNAFKFEAFVWHKDGSKSPYE